MKRQKRYIAVGLTLVFISVWLILAIGRFLSPNEQRDKEDYQKDIKPRIEESEAKLNLAAFPQQEQPTLKKLNSRLVVEQDSRTRYVVAGAFFSGALSLALLGVIIILFGRIKDLEHQLSSRENNVQQTV
jgi:high-affinity Fe2+/Pb2+ permease